MNKTHFVEAAAAGLLAITACAPADEPEKPCNPSSSDLNNRICVDLPRHLQKVSFWDNVEVTAAGLLEGETVWVLITDEGDNRYHPQSGVAQSIGSNRLRAIARYGQENDRNKRYTISTLTADQAATAELKKYMDEKQFPGYTTLPPGARLQLHQQRVKRETWFRLF